MGWCLRLSKIYDPWPPNLILVLCKEETGAINPANFILALKYSGIKVDAASNWVVPCECPI